MPDWQNLPTEILHNIFQRIDREDNNQCCLTCRAWRPAAQCALFAILPTFTDESFNALAMTLMHRKREDSPGNFAKNVCCDKLSEEFDLALLDLTFPFLEEIVMYVYKQSFYDKFYGLLKDGMFINLKKLPLGNWKNDYLELVLSRKEQLTKLDAFELSFESNAYKLFEQLDQFPKLKTLCFNWQPDYDTTVYSEDMFSIHNSTLEEIQIGNSGGNQIDLKSSNADISSIQPYPNVKELYMGSGGLFFDGDQMYLYLMKKFPNLQILALRSYINELNRTPSYTAPTLATLSQFLVYLFNIKEESYVDSVITNQLTTKVITNFYDYIFSLSPQTLKNLNLVLKMQHNIVSPESYSSDYSACINVSMEERERNEIEKLCKVSVTYNITVETITLPHLEVFQKIGGINLNYLIIGEAYSCTAQQGEKIGSLDIVFNHFTKLKKLKLCSLEDIYFTEKTSDLERKTPSTLKTLHFKFCHITQEIFHKISVRCRNLESMKIKRCYFVQSHTDQGLQTLRRVVSLNMPFTRLHELLLYIELDEFSEGEAFIRLTTENEKPRYCKLNRIVRGNDCVTAFESQKDNYTDDDYKLCLYDNDCTVYDIYCKSVTKLKIEVHDWKISIDKRKKVFPGENKVEEL